jgi:hypothetical protein
MSLLKRFLAGVGGIAILAFALQLAAPRAVHAVAAALVQVTNTPSSPAITQDVSNLASTKVNLSCNPTCVQIFPDGTVARGDFSVPAGQSLVINTVQLNASGAGTTLLRQEINNIITDGNIVWELFAAGTYQFQYPTGIVFAPGTTRIGIGSTVASGYMFGYLTNN